MNFDLWLCIGSCILVVSSRSVACVEDADAEEHTLNATEDVAAALNSTSIGYGRGKRQSYYGMIDREFEEFDGRRCTIKMESSFTQCCIGGLKTSFQLQKMWDLKLQCLSEIYGNVIRRGGSIRAPPCDRLNPRKEEIWCFMQCMSKRLNLLDDSGNFIEAPLKQHVRIDLVQDAWQQDAANDIVELCNIEVRRVDPRESPSPSAKCRSTSLRLFNCVWREMIKACPRHLQSNSIACLRMRQNMHNYEDVNEDAYPYPYVGHGGGFPSRDSRIN